jgi:L-ascorbate metabolism protein UlaG (beta-lactamase superfamily)
MLIRKFLHSCLLVEERGKKLLFDPGTFSFVEKQLKPEDIGPVDVIVLTHSHPDHYFPGALKALCSFQEAKIIANEEICSLLRQEGLPNEPIKAGETKEVAGFKIQAFEAPHGRMPLPVPVNLAFLINDRLFNPGDSLDVQGIEHCKILALPIAAPWLTLVQALDFAKRLRPKQVIPIHDRVVSGIFIDRLYDIMVAPTLQKEGISFHPLKLGQELSV